MVRVPYRFLIVSIAALVGVLSILPMVNGSSDSGSSGSGGNGEHLIVVERLTPEFLVYLNHQYEFTESTRFEGIERAAIEPGTWLMVTSHKDGATYQLETVKLAARDHLVLSGTISSLIFDDANEVIGFALNGDSILIPHHEGEEAHPVSVGYGVNVTVKPDRVGSFLQAESIEIIRHHDLLHSMMVLMLQIAVILLVAKIFGEIFERYLKQPTVLGELLGGILMSPYAFGHLINIPGVGPLFETVNLSTVMKASPLQPNFAVSPELWAIAQIAAIILLFMAGLETDLNRFLRYAGPATVVAVGGVVLPFVFGVFITIWLVPGLSIMEPAPLFMGAILVATSVGITARVLSDINKLDTSEGVTVLAGAVIDDVLGILVLAIVNAIAIAELAGKAIDIGLIGEIAAKAILFWLGLTFIGILASKRIEKFLNWFKSKGASFAIGLSICFASAAAAEMFGLAMIIGAYSIGLAMSGRDIAQNLEEKLSGAYNFVVPIFFTVMGMMVDINAMMPLFWPYGVVISIAAVLGKIVGCGLPALFVGFNPVGAWRIGVGMMPRGEVALIIAGVGIANGIIATDMFGVAILITLVTTLLAPPLLVPAFQRGGLGTRKEPEKVVPIVEKVEGPLISVPVNSIAHQVLLKDMFLDAMEETGYEKVFSSPEQGIFEIQKDGKLLVVRLDERNGKPAISVDAVVGTRDHVRNAFARVTELMENYGESIINEIVRSDPKFRRKVKRVTSE